MGLKDALKGNQGDTKSLIRSLVKAEVDRYKEEINQELRRALEEKLDETGLNFLKGDRGFTPKKGVDYFTAEDIAEVIKKVTPQKGVHYRDGRPGKSPDPMKIAQLVMGMISKPKEVKVPTIEEIIAALKKKVKAEDLEGWEQTISVLRNAARLGGGGGGGGTLEHITISGTQPGTSFTLSKSCSFFLLLRNGQTQRPSGVDFTYTPGALTLTTVDTIASGETLAGIGQPG